MLDHDTSKTGVKVTDEVGGTPAHDAADNGELECLTLLVERGADIFAEDLNKATPYLLGLECGNDEVKSYLRKLAMSLGNLFIYLFVCLSVCLLFVCLFVCLFIYSFICLFVCV